MLHDEVYILMRTGLFAEERIYSPPSVEPHSEWDSLEGIKDAQNVGSFHQLIFLPGPDSRSPGHELLSEGHRC